MSDDQWRADEPSAPRRPPAESSKEWRLIEKALLAGIGEQRRARRWGIFFKFLTFGYLFVLLGLFSRSTHLDEKVGVAGRHTALIDVQGVIAEGEEAQADSIVTALRSAFDEKHVAGIVLRINSPGGSPVQAGYVYDEIKRLRALHPQVKVYAVIADIGASGAYYIAAAADQIYADKASLVGSIGVVSSSFGFVDALKKLGVERRLFTSGEHKGFLDPFSPLNPQEQAYWQQVLDVTHRQFIEQVKAGRGSRLNSEKSDLLFSGLVWSGEQARELGLIDGLGSPGYVAREVIGAEQIVNYTEKPTPFEKLARRMESRLDGAALTSDLFRTLPGW
jgi:protease-4